MSKGNTFENDLLKLIFNADGIANLADNAGTSPLTNLWVALHTADPGEAGNASTNEATYTNYARVSVARSTSGWTVSGANVNNVNQVTFPECGTTGNTITHASITTAATGASKILYSGALSSSLSVTNGITPFFPATTGITVTED